MAMNELVSIIMPIYNVEKYLAKSINSILNQSYRNIELILVNDGSSDNSLRICNEYSYKDKRVRVFDIENSGVSTARNVGLSLTSGHYVTFIDADDWVEDTMIETLLKYMKEDVDLVICGYKEILVEGISFKVVKDVYVKEVIAIELDDFIRQYYYYHKEGIITSIWNKIYKRSIIQKNNIKFQESLSLAEDILFNIHYLQHSTKITNIEKSLYNYVKYNDNRSLSTKFNPKELESQEIVNTEIMDILSDFGEFKGSNRSYFIVFYSRTIIGSVINYLRKCDESYKDKVIFLKSIYVNEKIMKGISLFNNGSFRIDAFGLLIILRRTNIMICSVQILSLVKTFRRRYNFRNLRFRNLLK